MSFVGAVTGTPIVQVVVRVLGLAFLTGIVTAIVGFAYRARTGSQFPDGATLIVGWGIVALYLNTRLALVQFVGDSTVQLTVWEAGANLAVLGAAAIASYVGRNAGDTFGASGRGRRTRSVLSLSPIVRATGRFISLELPAEVEDIVGYDPIPPATKQILAGKRFDFPRGLSVEDLESQLSERLTEEYDIWYVDVDVTPDGTVDYLAVGQRPAGVGPTLPPDTVAVAVDADPPFSASAGDTVQLWRTPDGAAPERLGTGELRGSVGSIVTLALEEGLAAAIDPTASHRLMTLPAEPNPDREFATMLRRAPETMAVVEIPAESPLVDVPLGAIDLTVIAIQHPSGELETVPTRSRRIEAGASLFVIAMPDAIRQLETGSGTTVGSPRPENPTVSGLTLEPDPGSDRVATE